MTTVNHLLRDIAPLDDATWDLIDDEATSRLKPALAARRLVDVVGPLGWEHSATNVGRATAVLDAPRDGVTARQRIVLPLAEVQAAARLDREELLAFSRGAVDVDLGPLDDAAAAFAATENAAVFAGWEAFGITGVAAASPHAPLVHDGAAAQYEDVVALALATLKRAGVDGPYGLAAGPDTWVDVIESSDSGYPIQPRLEEILGGPVVWTPGIEGAVVLSLRGGDFLLELGQDVSVGYRSHDAAGVDLYLEETFSFRVATPEAAIAIRSA
jgi:uncharacterized linocin/CFP29 family protein